MCEAHRRCVDRRTRTVRKGGSCVLCAERRKTRLDAAPFVVGCVASHDTGDFGEHPINVGSEQIDAVEAWPVELRPRLRGRSVFVKKVEQVIAAPEGDDLPVKALDVGLGAELETIEACDNRVTKAAIDDEENFVVSA